MQEEVNLKLQELLEKHSLNIVPYKEWLTVDGGLPGFHASIHRVEYSNQSVSLQLDIDVVVEPGIVITESFAGWGNTIEEAMGRAFANFAINSLHVFLTGFCGRTDNQATVEEWEIDGLRWDVVIGGITTMNWDDQEVPLPESLFQTIENMLRGKKLEPRIHWLRVYYCNTGDGNIVCECLLDNETWEDAEQQVKKLGWVDQDNFYSVRNFLIMLLKQVDKPSLSAQLARWARRAIPW